MALDEPRENDQVIEEDGFSWIIDRDLKEASGDIEVDFVNTFIHKGFKVTSAQTPGEGGCSC